MQGTRLRSKGRSGAGGTNDALRLAFNGNLSGSGVGALNDEGIWIEQGGALTLLVREGDLAAGLPGLEFAGFNRTLSFGNGGHLAFLADLRDVATGEGRGVAQVMTDPAGGLHVLVRTGEVFDVAGDGSDLRVVAAILRGIVSATGEIPFELGFIDGSTGLFVAKVTSPLVGVPPGASSATRVALAAPEPNPRVESGPVTLRFSLGAPAAVRVTLHDLAGREVAARAAEYVPIAGARSMRWDPGRLAPGVYFVRLELD